MEPGDKIRLDKWLWFARFFKSRSLAADVCKRRKVRLNGSHVSKPSIMVGPGDILTFPKATRVRVIKILAPGERRGPAVEAQSLYEDLSPAEPTDADKAADQLRSPSREKGMGRPTKADRRAIDKLRQLD